MHCQYKDDQNNPCENPTPCTIQCRECLLDVCEEHQALGSKLEEDYDREGDEGDITEAVHRETVLCLTCAYDLEKFERRAWIREGKRAAARLRKNPRAMTLTPHACPGGHPRCECGAYTACCSFTIQREELFAFTTLCGDCSNPICENCAAWFETDDPPYGRCIECDPPQERRREKRTNTGEIVAKGHIKATEGSK